MATEAYMKVRRREIFCEATPLYEKMGELPIELPVDNLPIFLI
jgi:hypothetical protein